MLKYCQLCEEKKSPVMYIVSLSSRINCFAAGPVRIQENAVERRSIILRDLNLRPTRKAYLSDHESGHIRTVAGQEI